MTYTPQTVDDSRGAEGRAYPTNQTCLKLALSTTAGYKLIPRDVKTCLIYCAAACWVRIDKVEADAGAKSLATTTQDNVIYVPAGSFLLAQETEFNQITAKSVSGTPDLYMYPGYGAGLTTLTPETLLT